MTKLSVRSTSPADIDALLKLQAHVYPTIAPWRRDQLAHHPDYDPTRKPALQLAANLNEATA